MVHNLQTEDNTWIEDPTQILNHIESYYFSLFKSDHSKFKQYQYFLGPVTLSDSEKDLLSPLPSEKEVRRTIHSFKPSRIRRISPLFYQKCRHIVGPSVISFCKNAFANECIPEYSKKTYVCLIPKCKNVISLKNFRPISLCNLSYKIVTKIIS